MSAFFRPLSCALALALALSAAISAPAHSRVLDAVAIMHQPASNNICALTFDDGPTAFTSQLLDSLKEEGVQATFFLLGQQISRRPEVVRRMAEEGHEVASHGYSHPNMRKLNATAREKELGDTNALLAELNVTPRYFRPPYGKFDKELAAMALDMGMNTVMWTTDSRDWKRRPDYSNMQNTSGRRMQREEMRGVFLFHDTKQATVQDLRHILSNLRAGGCERFVTVSEYFKTVEVEEPLMTARPDIPERELQPSRVARATDALSTESPAAQVAEEPAPTQDAASADSSPQPSKVPLARSSVPWFLPQLYRSGG